MKRFFLLFSVGTLMICALSILFPASSALSDGEKIRDSVIRLHVLANSDDPVDQDNKLLVRDRLLSEIDGLTDGCTDRSDAEAILREKIPELTELCASVLKEAGSRDTVRITLTEEYYPTREYEDLRLPAGRYLSLRVILGAGEGHNWWCVLFPPVCTSSAKADEELAEVGFTPNQVRMLTDEEDVHYVIRFKIVEVVSNLKERFRFLFSK